MPFNCKLVYHFRYFMMTSSALDNNNADECFDKKIDDIIEELIDTDINVEEEVHICKSCQQEIRDEEASEVGDEIYHSDCFTCDHCFEK